MIAGDTNIVLRLILDDEPRQIDAIRRLMQRQRLFVSLTVLLETGWVLESRYRMPRPQVVASLDGVTTLDGVTIVRPSLARWAIDRYQAGGDWADMVHIVSAAKTQGFATLDRAVHRKVGAACPVPIENARLMAKLYFYYASMNAGKSTNLLQAAFNYAERGQATMLFTAGVDDRFVAGTITSRIGLTAPAAPFDAQTDIAAAVRARTAQEPLACVMVDEAQFLSAAQVDQLARLCDEDGIPVLAYGLRTDFRGDLFPGSARLLAIADSLVEIKSVCRCGRKATMNLRVDADGHPIAHGAQTAIGGNESYVALCRRHFTQALGQPAIVEALG